MRLLRQAQDAASIWSRPFDRLRLDPFGRLLRLLIIVCNCLYWASILKTVTDVKTVLRWLWLAYYYLVTLRSFGNHCSEAVASDTGKLSGCPVFTDQFNVYPLIVPPEQHPPVPKGAGLTNHQERWYNTLRRWVGRYTRRTLSFSKEDRYHELVTRWFILQHNLLIQQASCTMWPPPVHWK